MHSTHEVFVASDLGSFDSRVSKIIIIVIMFALHTLNGEELVGHPNNKVTIGRLAISSGYNKKR